MEDSRHHHEHDDECEHCGHHHDHGHEHGHDHGEEENALPRLIISAVLLAAAFLLDRFLIPDDGWWRFASLAAYLIPYIIVGADVIVESANNIVHGELFDECFLMTVATFGAFAIGEYSEAVFVMLFYSVGEFLQDLAVDSSKKKVTALLDIRPDHASVMRDGRSVSVNPADVSIGEIIVVSPGERIPLDGVIVSGAATLDASALTGESRPVAVRAGDEVMSGCIDTNAGLTIKVVRRYGESTVSRILDLVENASAKKAKSERFITRFARYYTPAVVIGAVLLTVIPTLFGGGFIEWLRRSLMFLVVSCPCALVISVPLAYFGGIGGASANGILVKGSNYLEMISSADTVVFDKTGTLTKGNFEVRRIDAVGIDGGEFLRLAAHAEAYSTHPIAASLRRAYHGETDESVISDVRELPGLGIEAVVGGAHVQVGNAGLIGGAHEDDDRGGDAVVYMAVNGRYVGRAVISDTVKDDARATVSALKSLGIRTVMLTGDRRATADAVAESLGIDEAHSGLLPADKVNEIERLISEGGRVAFVGDGINDAPVLVRSDVGIAMGALGSDAAIEAADIVIMDDKPSRVLDIIAVSRKTRRIVTENIVFSLAVKAAVLTVSAVGIASMWLAVFADVGVALIAILNSLRALGVKKR
ncbi:MAG: cadmium-translocating P-type ATPase [Clostridia bacterium]|nr:cadmium-translocating P-type ATPase [Clostridia bacterium]